MGVTSLASLLSGLIVPYYLVCSNGKCCFVSFVLFSSCLWKKGEFSWQLILRGQKLSSFIITVWLGAAFSHTIVIPRGFELGAGD